MNEITTVGVDLAKDVIVVCAGDAQGRPMYFKHFSFASSRASTRVGGLHKTIEWKSAISA
jgi:hypothetical protein